MVTRDDRNYRALWCLNRVCKLLLEEHEKDVPSTVGELYNVRFAFYLGDNSKNQGLLWTGQKQQGEFEQIQVLTVNCDESVLKL